MLARTLLTSAAALAVAAGLGGAALAQDVPTVTILAQENPQDAEHIARIEEAMTEAGTPVDIELIGLPSSGYSDAMGLRLLSGEVPDIVYFQGGDAEFASQGVLEDLPRGLRVPELGGRHRAVDQAAQARLGQPLVQRVVPVGHHHDQ